MENKKTLELIPTDTSKKLCTTKELIKQELFPTPKNKKFNFSELL